MLQAFQAKAVFRQGLARPLEDPEVPRRLSARYTGPTNGLCSGLAWGNGYPLASPDPGRLASMHLQLMHTETSQRPSDFSHQ
jgi:hypothetical protein